MANGLTYTCTCRTPGATERLAASLAPRLRAGDIFLLDGDLGAGKTCFVQGVAQALGIQGDVTSPTFNILISYEDGMLPLNHFDLYRLETADQLYDIGYWDVLEGSGASFVEWGDRFPDDAPSDYVEIRMTVEEDGARIIRVHSYGERARRLLFLWGDSEESGLMKADAN